MCGVVQCLARYDKCYNLRQPQAPSTNYSREEEKKEAKEKEEEKEEEKEGENSPGHTGSVN